MPGGKRYRAAAPAGMAPGTPFGPGIRALLLYLHHSHHVGFERLARMMDELFGLRISQGAIANALRRMQTGLDDARTEIREKLRAARIIASDETTPRIDGKLHWHWVFLCAQAVLHEIAPGRGRSPWPRISSARIAPGAGFPTAMPASRSWGALIRSASPTSCATFNTPSTPAIPSTS
jgi:hypothetical protein